MLTLVYILLACVVLAVVLSAPFILVGRLLRRWRYRRLTRSARPGFLVVVPGHRLGAEHRGISYEYQVPARGNRRHPPRFRLRLVCRTHGDFRLGPETGFDRFFKRHGIAVEIQTGDAVFDERVYVNTDSVDFCRASFASASVRSAVLALDDRKYQVIRHNGRYLEAERVLDECPDLLSEDTVTPVVDLLKSLADNLPVQPFGPRLLGVTRWKVVRALVIGAAVLAVAGGGFVLLEGGSHGVLDGARAFFYSLPVSVPAGMLFAVLAVGLLRGRSTSHLEVALWVPLAATGFLMAGYGAVLWVNADADGSEVVRREVDVVRKHVRHGRHGGTSYHAVLASWRPGHRTERITVPSHVYERIVPGRSVMTIGTRSGRLGFEWVVSSSLKRPE